ncbi:hypothetical protein SBRCBS47491_002151 [Sporothrix bragantina]|uniref:Major facilitator superfamily (MFS) profile domain-containing protein n=1 Tax=Sporothrix bragantina TaxID=671064 RepID=A0ABP0B4L8_9PEZI
MADIAPVSPIGGKTTMEDISHDAETATAVEKSMGIWEAIRKYPKAVFFSFTLSLCVIMEGYDTALLGSFYGLPQFNKRFGNQLPDGSYQLTSSWQSGLQNGTQVGQMLGLLFAGLLADRFGYRKTLIGALVMTIGLIFIFFFAQNIGMLFAAEMLCGLPWGAFQTLTTTYAADVTPIPLRPLLTTYVNMCWVIGQFLATGVLRGLLSRADDWAWRIPYAIQWVFPPFIIVGILFAPESPIWLVRKGRIDEARKALRKLTTAANMSETEIEQTVSMYVHTNALEKNLQEGTSYWDCLRGPNRRRTEIACCVWVAQVACGIWFGGNVVYFLEQAGFDPEKSFDFGVGENAIALVGTVAAWFVIPRLGRRTLFVSGLSIMLTILLAVGFMGIPSIKGKPGLGWASGALMMIFVFSYDMTVGPVCYCLVAEVPSTRLRIKTVVLARNAYLIASLVANFLNPPILNPSAWNLRGKGGFIWAAFCFLMLAWTYFRLPETTGRSAAELDLLFEQSVPARDFKKATADPFHGQEAEKAAEEAVAELRVEKV